LAAFQTDLDDGLFELPTCNLAVVLIEAQRLSSSYTMNGGYRAFDILHVAAALHFGTPRVPDIRVETEQVSAGRGSDARSIASILRSHQRQGRLGDAPVARKSHEAKHSRDFRAIEPPRRRLREENWI
jgi:hypothetical protein